MFEDFKTILSLQIKKIEIAYKAWINAREIAKAYNTDVPRSKINMNFLTGQFRKICIYCAVLTGVVFVIIGTIATVKHFQKSIAVKSVIREKSIQHQVVSKVMKKDTISKLPKKLKSIKKDSVAKILLKKDTVVMSKKVAFKAIPDTKTKKAESVQKVSFISKIKTFFSRMNYKPEKVTEKPVKKNMDTLSNVKQEAVIAASGAGVIDTTALKPVHVFMKKRSIIKADYYIIVANKAKRILYLLRQNADQEWFVEKEFPIAIGAGLSGPKISAGDKRTPEGIYFIILRRNKFELNDVYGPLSYVLNYPNENDIKEGRTGQGIWIHGTEGSGDPIPTKGCLSLSNNSIIELSSYIKNGNGTPVVIVNDPLLNDPVSIVDFEKVYSERIIVSTQQERLLADVNKYLSSWVDAWESRDIEKYQNYYSQDEFSSQGMEWIEWKEKKIQTFQSYKTIDVTIDKVKLSDWTDVSLEVTFMQYYRSDQKYFENGKKLFLEKDSSTWKITREINIPKEELLL